MKKIILLFWTAMLLSCSTHLANAQSPYLVTLNGYSMDEADKMVQAHFDKPGDYRRTNRTNIWFSKDVIKNIVQILDDEKADGVRIYFADDAIGHNIIIVSTKEQGFDENGNIIHQDYFRHQSPFLKTPEVKGSVDHGINATSLANSYSDLFQAFRCPPGPGNCPVTGDPNHNLSCEDAISWINNYSVDANDKLTEISEWFDLPFLHILNDELQKETNGADGVRIYFAKKTLELVTCIVLYWLQLKLIALIIMSAELKRLKN